MLGRACNKAILGVYILAFAIIAAITGINVPFAVFFVYSLVCSLIALKLDIKGRHFGLLLFVFAFFLRAVCVVLIKTPPDSDFKLMYDAAQSFARGDYSFNQYDYFYDWAYQSVFVIYQGTVIKIFGAGYGIWALKFLNAIYSSASCLLIYLIARNFVRDKTARFCSLVCAGLVFPMTFVTVLTNQHLSGFLALLGLFIITDENIKTGGILRHVLAGFFIALSNIIRPEGILLLGALLAVYLIRLLKPKNEKRGKIVMRYIILLAVYLATNFLASQAVIYSGVNPEGLKNNNVLWKFVQGLNYETKGTYSQDDYLLVYKSGYSREERKQIELSLIKERLAMGPDKWIKLILYKQYYLWGKSPLYWTYRYLKDTKPSVNLLGIQMPFDTATDILDDTHSMQMFILILLSMIGAAFNLKDKPDEKVLLYFLIVLFTAGIYAFIEVQIRYVYFAQHILVILAATGLEAILKFAAGLRVLTDQTQNRVGDT